MEKKSDRLATVTAGVETDWVDSSWNHDYDRNRPGWLRISCEALPGHCGIRTPRDRNNKHKSCAILGNPCAATAVRNWHYRRDKEPGPNNLPASPSSSIIIRPLLIMKNSHKAITAGLILLAGATLGLAAPVTENWENHCTKCHGEDGKGQTKVGKKLKLKDYTDAKAQAEMKDEDMIKAIADGVNDAAGKEKMKAYKGELSSDEIKELVAYIRKFKA